MHDIEAGKSGSSKNDLLKYLIENAVRAPKNKEFIEAVVKRILPEMRENSAIEGIDARLRQNRDNLSKLEAEIPAEMEKSFEFIKSYAEEKKYFQNPAIYRMVRSIDQLFLEKEKHSKGDHSYVSIAYIKIEQLLNSLLSFDADVLVSKYGEIKRSHIPMVDVFTGEWVMAPKHVDISGVSASYFKGQSLARLLSSGEEDWAALDILYQLEWYWNTPESFFGPDQKDSLLYSRWDEINRLKKGDEHALSFFSREKIMSCLGVITQKMLYGIDVLTMPHSNIAGSLLEPYLVEKEGRAYFLMDVYSFKEIKVKTYEIHGFENEKSGPFQILKKLFATYKQFDSPNQRWINIVKACNTAGINSSAKLHSRISTNNVLGNIIFDSKGSRMRVKNLMISCRSLSDEHREQLEELLETLELYRG